MAVTFISTRRSGKSIPNAELDGVEGIFGLQVRAKLMLKIRANRLAIGDAVKRRFRVSRLDLSEGRSPLGRVTRSSISFLSLLIVSSSSCPTTSTTPRSRPAAPAPWPRHRIAPGRPAWAEAWPRTPPAGADEIDQAVDHAASIQASSRARPSSGQTISSAVDLIEEEFPLRQPVEPQGRHHAGEHLDAACASRDKAPPPGRRRPGPPACWPARRSNRNRLPPPAGCRGRPERPARASGPESSAGR